MVDVIVDMRSYFELLHLADSLPENKKSLSETDSRELLNYRIIFDHKTQFNKRNHYLKLIQEYCEAESSEEEFSAEAFDLMYYFLRRCKRDGSIIFEENFRENPVSTILVDSRAKKFSELLYLISSWNESLTDSEPDQLSEEEHRKEIQKILVEIQNLLKEE